MILVNGCSYTHGNLNAIDDNFLGETWGFQVGKHLNMNVTNIAMSGSGPDYVLRKTINWILKNGNPDMVLIGWPNAFRFEFPSEKRWLSKTYKHRQVPYDGLTRYTDGTYNLNWKDSFNSQFKQPYDANKSFYSKNDIENGIDTTHRFGGLHISKCLHFKVNKINEDKFNLKTKRLMGSPVEDEWGKVIELYDYTIFALWLAEKKLFAMITLESFLKSRNIKYYWFDWCNTVTNEYTDGILLQGPAQRKQSFNQIGELETHPEHSIEISYKAHKECLSFNTKFLRKQNITDGVGFWSNVNGYLPGWRWREQTVDAAKNLIGAERYLDTHYLLDWHEWFGKEFANFIKTGKDVTNKRDYDKMYDEYLKAIEDPTRHPPSNFLEKIKNYEKGESKKEVVIEDHHDDFVYD